MLLPHIYSDDLLQNDSHYLYWHPFTVQFSFIARTLHESSSCSCQSKTHNGPKINQTGTLSTCPFIENIIGWVTTSSLAMVRNCNVHGNWLSCLVSISASETHIVSISTGGQRIQPGINIWEWPTVQEREASAHIVTLNSIRPKHPFLSLFGMEDWRVNKGGHSLQSNDGRVPDTMTWQWIGITMPLLTRWMVILID